ncbi:erythromycin esterase [Allocatelliglobosispora scoriae]|uniref:Erythromycin esterase n=1 Tax=Allocatelliglobosispora scoriae TaxID=643052 RepID=A0A841BM07_9ACTN|nr:erythromycin esterase family protein [Allocatelliglobosispora scoriae]MBB5868388.1 erythromycin esterase [Allocatelliglobosispora scoriae]
MDTSGSVAGVPTSDVEIGAWLRANGSLLRTITPAEDDDFGDLEPLRELVGDARIVGLGESTHRIHEFYQVRDRLSRFLVAELGFTAVVLESGFGEGRLVDEWIGGGPGEPSVVLRDGITYSFGRCAELRTQIEWLRAVNAAADRRVRFYGMDLSDSSGSALPAVREVLAYLDRVDPAYAEAVRSDLLPLFDYLPTDRSGIAWVAPTLHAYMALEQAVRHELTARISDLPERLAAMRIIYIGRSDRESFEFAYRCAATARHTDAFLTGFPDGATRGYQGANYRDAAMAENIEWILDREERIVVLAANGHLQRTPWSAPPIITTELTMLGAHLAAAHGERYVSIATAFGGGELLLHRPHPDDPPGHSRLFTEELRLLDPASLDELLAGAGMPHYLLDLRRVPAEGPVARRFAATTSMMTGGQATPVDALAAFDAVVYVDQVSPWHHSADWGRRDG